MNSLIGHRYGMVGGVVVMSALVSLPAWAGSTYFTSVAIVSLVFIVLSMGLNLIFGYTGLLSFAQVAFWGAGGYTGALLVVALGWSPWIAVVCAGAVAALLAFIVGYPALRLSRHSFAIVTLSFALLMEMIARDWVGLTRGPMGIPGLPALRVNLFGLASIDGANPRGFYLIMLGYTVIVLVTTYLLVRSPIGRTFSAVKLNEVLAQSQGINVNHYKLLALAISALFSGLAGGLYVFHLSIVDPTIFDFYYSEMMLIIVILGGAGTFGGVVLASVVFTVLPELLRVTPQLQLVLFGIVLIISLLAFPEGLGGYLKRRRFERARRQAWSEAK